MTIKIGINGFGRIGRNVFRSAIKSFSDIEIVGMPTLELAVWARDHLADFDQIICEWSWTHIGLCDGKPRGQKMTAKRGPDGKAVYSMGFNP